MKRSGLTLIELLVVLVIIGIISLITIPILMPLVNSYKNKIYAETIKNIEDAAQLYVVKNINNFPTTVGSRSFVTLNTLKDNGYLDEDLIDPRDSTEIINGEVVIELLSSGEYSYNYYSTDYVTSGLAVWYDGLYRGNTNTVWEDRSGNSRNATLYNFDFDTNNGWFSDHLRFDGTTYAYMPNSVGYTTTFSAFALIKIIGTPIGGYHIVFGGTSLELSIPTAGQLRTGLDTSARYVSNHGSGLADGNWHQVGFTFDGTSKKSYIDGVYVGELPVSGTLVHTFANRSIGRLGSSTSYYLNGNIANVMIYNRSLSASEIYQNYLVDKERFNF